MNSEQMHTRDRTMKRTTISTLTALILTLAACSKGSEPEHGEGADMTSGADNAAGSHPSELNASPGEGGLGTGATGVDPDNVGNPPAPDTTNSGPSSAGTGGGAGTGGSTGSSAGMSQ
jgi:hypothetical protein